MKAIVTHLIAALALASLGVTAVHSETSEDAARAFENGDYSTAFELWRPLAQQGDARAQLELGRMYLRGQGRDPDYRKALKWIRRAAEQGDVTAQYWLGMMYADGLSTRRDFVASLMWFNIAANRGNESASRSRDGILIYMSPSQIIEAQRLAQEWRPTRNWVEDAASSERSMAERMPEP